MTELLQDPLVLLGWLLCLGVLGAALIAINHHFRSSRLIAAQFDLERRLTEEKLGLLRARREKVVEETAAWEGFANFEVTRKVPHGDSQICSFYLEPKDKQLKLASFRPGQHLVFQLPIQGEAEPVCRRYSLSNHPGEDHYRVSVKLHPAPEGIAGARAGLGSSYFHETLEVDPNDPFRRLIQVGHPAGSFYIDPIDSRPLVLIGAGVGLTPMLSMFNSIIEENETREVWFFYTVREAAESILFDEGMLHPRAEDVLKTQENLHLHVFYTKVSNKKKLPKNLPSRVEQHCGRLTVENFKTLLPSNNYRFYICGPEAMMDQFETDLEDWGVPEEDVLSERFQPPTKRRTESSDATGHTIRFAKSGKEVTFDADDNTILDVAERAGVPIAFDCRAGSCGQCKVAVASGKVSYNIRTNYKCPPGSCLTCSCVPKEDLVLDC